MTIYTGPEGLSKLEASSCREGAASGRGEVGTLLPADVQMPPEAQPRGRKGGHLGTLGFRFWKVCHYPRGRAVGPGTPGGGMCLGMKKMDWNSELMKPFVLEGLPWWLRG